MLLGSIQQRELKEVAGNILNVQTIYVIFDSTWVSSAETSVYFFPRDPVREFGPGCFEKLKTEVAKRENLDRAHPSYSLGKANANLKFPAFPEIGHRK